MDYGINLWHFILNHCQPCQSRLELHLDIIEREALWSRWYESYFKKAPVKQKTLFDASTEES